MSSGAKNILSEPSPEMVPEYGEGKTAGLDPDEYIEDRVKSYQSWYDAKARQYKSLYLRSCVAAVVMGTSVPVIVNLDFVGKNAVVTVLALGVAILVALEGVLHHRDQWKNYRTAEQSLGHERIIYLASIGPYQGLSPKQAFLRFVDRVEDAILSENRATLSVMTAPASTEDSRPAADNSP